MIKNTTPIIEIHGTGIHNRGAELMAIAISEKIWSLYPNAKIVVPSTFGFPSDISRYGFFTSSTLELLAKRAVFSLTIAGLTGKIIKSKKVDVVLDASGFAFSDQWGEYFPKHLFQKMIAKHRVHQSLILMPQALGKFEKKDVSDWTKKLFSRADIVFARDEQSYKYSEPLIDLSNKLKLSPDFTIAVKPLENSSIQLPEKFVAIVPNLRMLDKSDDPEAYLNFLKKSIELILKNGLVPLFLIHDAKEDLKVVATLGENYSNIEAIQHQDPRVLKWILGQAQFVIGSRFHALVSTMSQGVPCIGAGWSHKYPELFADFSNRDGLIDNLADLTSLEKQITIFSNQVTYVERSKQIQSAANELKNKVDQMWKLIIENINQHLEKKVN
ncbi:polysaccharide pyruvyl transferase family protein [Acinetobacter bouvetii]|uniref:Polysaccharide pyruvyl transferase n=1 Tax=Acinetobacter bouvetii TaxID=202951 RepID=A0A811GCN9_9GAMM|nr:polysaccharide pyruvyl transferase family protein [Acinetobacter bouvetii]CAB1220493.1 Polysaccharide pyruvyl transferase [Acinetobacter bouvetii]